MLFINYVACLQGMVIDMTSNITGGHMEYFFYGRIYPDHTYLNVGKPLRGRIEYEEQHFEVAMNVYSSNVVVSCECSRCIDDILTFRNLLLGFVDSLLNVICLLHGVMYRIEFLSYVCTGDKTFVAFKHSFEVEEQVRLVDKYGDRFMDILFCTQTKVGFFVADCLSNMKLSMSSPIDTGFYVYRAIENIRNAYMLEHDIPDDKEKEGWKVMNQSIGGDIADLDWLRNNFSTPRRHGRDMYISGEDRTKAINLGYKFIHSWIDYIVAKYAIDTKVDTKINLL
jgi:hypothetical protein